MPGYEMIADIGGSSSRWALVSDSAKVKVLGKSGVKLPGFNPVVGDPNAFVGAVRATVRSAMPAGVLPVKVTVYGAGCSTAARCGVMRRSVEAICGKVPVEVHSDLLGTARSLCGNEPGIVLIVGTGMNAGYFDGHTLHTPMPSLGWILGDEGSGADIGKGLLCDAVHARVPANVMLAVFGRKHIDVQEALALISGPSPNAHVAALVKRLKTVERNAYVRALLRERFDVLAELLGTYFAERAALGVRATGGVAQAFTTALKASLSERGFRLRKVEADPLDGLIAWHRSHRKVPTSPVVRRRRR